jgi:hypothetical protein
MTIGLLPILSSTATGADLMKRVAALMVGGLASERHITNRLETSIQAHICLSAILERVRRRPVPQASTINYAYIMRVVDDDVGFRT